MAEVFRGTPAIVTVGVWDQEGKKVEYHVCGRDMDKVKEAVVAALSELPDQDIEGEVFSEAKPKRKRRTKAEMTEAPKELATAGAGKSVWPND